MIAPGRPAVGLTGGAGKSLRADNGQAPLDLALGEGAQDVVDLFEPGE